LYLASSLTCAQASPNLLSIRLYLASSQTCAQASSNFCFVSFVLGFLTNVCSSFLKLAFDSFVLGFLTNVCSSFLKRSFVAFVLEFPVLRLFKLPQTPFRSSLITFHLFTFVFNRFRWLFFAYSVVFRHWFSRMFFFIRLSLTLMHESTKNSSLTFGIFLHSPTLTRESTRKNLLRFSELNYAISQFSLKSLKCTTEPVITCWNISTALLALKRVSQ
jgi:hypothetical protein